MRNIIKFSIFYYANLGLMQILFIFVGVVGV